MRLIATEEAWSIPEVAEELRKVANGPSQSLDKLLVKGIYDQEGGGAQYAGVNFRVACLRERDDLRANVPRAVCGAREVALRTI